MMNKDTLKPDFSDTDDAEIVIVMTRGEEGHRTKEELHRLIDNLPSEKYWAYSLVIAKKNKGSVDDSKNLKVEIVSYPDGITYDIRGNLNASNDQIARMNTYLDVVKQNLLESLNHDFEMFDEEVD